MTVVRSELRISPRRSACLPGSAIRQFTTEAKSSEGELGDGSNKNNNNQQSNNNNNTNHVNTNKDKKLDTRKIQGQICVETKSRNSCEDGRVESGVKGKNGNKNKKRQNAVEPSAFAKRRPKRGRHRVVEDNEMVLRTLARSLKEGKKVVFITGAGLSVASGIPPFRGQNDAVWSQSVHSWGTSEKFLEDPLAWYNTFWLAHFDASKADRYLPNPGHSSLAQICAAFPESTKVITQNIDRLHHHTVGRVDSEQLIEVHGFSGGFKCYTEGCKYSSERVMYTDIKELISKDDHGRSYFECEEKLPKCPSCSQTMCPNCLLFDEDYSVHDSYQFKKAKSWLRDADITVFIGTSFAVQITSLALCYATNKTPAGHVYNFNMIDNLPRSTATRLHAKLVKGKSEQTLPALAKILESPSSPTSNNLN